MSGGLESRLCRMTNTAPSPDCPHLSSHCLFMLYAINTQAPCLWGGESETGSAASSRGWFVNKPSLCCQPRCFSAFACRTLGNRNLSGNGCVSKQTSEITESGERPWAGGAAQAGTAKLLPLVGSVSHSLAFLPICWAEVHITKSTASQCTFSGVWCSPVLYSYHLYLVPNNIRHPKRKLHSP